MTKQKIDCAKINKLNTSPTLMRDLFEMKFAACGTYRDFRKGCPKSEENALPKDAPKGTMRWIREQPLLFAKWMDQREVSICLHHSFR